MDLDDEFEDRLRQSIQESIKLGYNPARFIQMLNTSDGVTLAKRLIASGELQDGVKKIVALGRPDLSMESIMLEPDFTSLFTEGEREAAQWRLSQLLRV